MCVSVSASVYAGEEGEALDTTPAAPASREPAGGGAPGRAGAAGEPSPRGGAARGPPRAEAPHAARSIPAAAAAAPGRWSRCLRIIPRAATENRIFLSTPASQPPLPPALSLPVIF